MLSAAEIVAQVLLGRTHLTGKERIRNVVLAGVAAVAALGVAVQAHLHVDPQRFGTYALVDRRGPGPVQGLLRGQGLLGNRLDARRPVGQRPAEGVAVLLGVWLAWASVRMLLDGSTAPSAGSPELREMLLRALLLGGEVAQHALRQRELAVQGRGRRQGAHALGDLAPALAQGV